MNTFEGPLGDSIELRSFCKQIGIDLRQASLHSRYVLKRIACIRIGPADQATTAALEIVTADGATRLIVLDPAHAYFAAKHLASCVDGSVFERAPSRWVMSLSVPVAANDSTADLVTSVAR